MKRESVELFAFGDRPNAAMLPSRFIESSKFADRSSLGRAGRSSISSTLSQTPERLAQERITAPQLPDGFLQLFPAVGAPNVESRPVKSNWSDEAVALSNSLLQAPQFRDGRGLDIRTQSQSFDPRWNRTTNRSSSRQLRADSRWLTHPHSASAQTLVQWCDAKERGQYSLAFQTGRVRPSVTRDLTGVTIGERGYAETPIHQAFVGYDAKIEKLADDRVRLVLTDTTSRVQREARVTIDTTRNVTLKMESLRDDVVVSTIEWSDYVQALGIWLPGRITHFDERGRQTSLTTQSVNVLAAEEFGAAFESELPDRKVVRLLPATLPTVQQAEVAVQTGSAGFAERLMLLLEAARIQNHDETLKQFAAIEEFAAGQPGMNWIKIGVLIGTRRFEEARQALIAEAKRLAVLVVEGAAAPIAPAAPADDYFRAEHIQGVMPQIADANEHLNVLQILKPVFVRQPEHVLGEWNFKRLSVGNLNALSRADEALAVQRELAAEAPWDVNVQTALAYALSNSGDIDAGLAWLRTVLDRREGDDPDGDFMLGEYEEAVVRNAGAGLLRDKQRYAELVDDLADWINRNPQQATAYRQYLSALIFADRVEDAKTTARDWIRVARETDWRLDEAALARLNSAVQFGLGNR